MKINFKLIALLLLFIIIIGYLLYNNGDSNNSDGNNDNTIEIKMYVHPWGAQIILDNVYTILNSGDVIDDTFKWYKEYKPYTGIYHLDTGSHLLTDLIDMDVGNITAILNENEIDYEKFDINYSYVQGGSTPYMIHQPLMIDDIKFKDFPVGLMSIYNQPNMLKERIACNGLFGLAMIENSHLGKYSPLNALLDKVTTKTILLDFKNKKMIVGSDINKNDYHFKGKMDYNSDLMRMDVWIKYNNRKEKILIDTGTLYSQFYKTGQINLQGVDENNSFGKLALQDAKILPYELVGQKPLIVGYNDLYKGTLFIDYVTNYIYINQNI
jgi:hypothetical protein